MVTNSAHKLTTNVDIMLAKQARSKKTVGTRDKIAHTLMAKS